MQAIDFIIKTLFIKSGNKVILYISKSKLVYFYSPIFNKFKCKSIKF